MKRDLTIAPAATTTRRVPEGVSGTVFRAVPSVFRRSRARSLAVLALLASLALLAPAPAEAQTAVWSGTLTVDRDGTYYGCSNTLDLDNCSLSSALNDNNFNYSGTTYTFGNIYFADLATDLLVLNLDVAWPNAIRTRGTLTVGSTNLSFLNATATDPNTIYWSNPGFSWTDNQSVSLSITVSSPPSLSSQGITQSAAQLTLANNSAAWWYKRTSPTAGTCTSRTSAQTTLDLSSLNANTSYTYKAYSKTGCNDADEIASETFTTLAVGSPVPPANFTATKVGDNVWLNWDAVSGAATYHYRVKGSGTNKNWSHWWSAWPNKPSSCASGKLCHRIWHNSLTNSRDTNGADQDLDNAATLTLQVRAVFEDKYRWWPGGASVEKSVTYGAGGGSQVVTPAEASLAVTPNPVDEGSPVTVKVTLSKALAGAVDVPLTVTRGTSDDGDHGTLASVTVSAGQTEGTGSIATQQDLDGDDETFTVALDTDNLPSSVTAGETSSATVTITDTTEGDTTPPVLFPGAPTGLAAEAGDSQVKLTWNAYGNAFGWEVSSDNGSTWATATGLGASATTWTVTGLDNGTEYTFKVRVTGILPALKSTASAGVKATPALQTSNATVEAPAPTTAPGPVQNIAATHTGTSLTVTWDAPAGATHYDVTYSGNGANARAAWNRAGTSLTITCDIRTGYENQHCVAGSAAYTVGVRARNAAGTSDWRNSAAAQPPAKPDPVSNIRVVHKGGSLDVSWDASARATAYDVTYYGNNVNARGAWNRTGTSLTITCDIRTGYENQNCVDSGSSYTVGVRARNAAGESAWRNSASAAPPSLAVADATVAEAASATLDFTVTLTRASSGQVTVDYATSDGTATAGSDYTAASGTLTFTAGQTSKTVSVAVLDDLHDESSETMTLTLSNASGAPVSDATATGTITNADPLQRQWLSRFGRTVAGQMIEALEGRFATGPGTPSHMTIGGQRIDFSGAQPAQDEGWPNRWRDRPEERGKDGETRGMEMRELLLGSSFHLTAGDVSGLGAMTGWGKALTGSSSASPGGGLTFTSETVTGVLGMDWERGNLLVGLALSESVESGGASGPSEYDLEGSLSLVTPYARLKASDRLSFWTMTGTGQGSLSFAHGDARLDADIAMQMVAAGGRADLLKPDEGGGLALALKTDAFFVRTESESVSRHGVGNLAGATGDASRVRAVLEGSRAFALSGGGSVEPSLTLGLRHDGGDAETGSGVEVGAGLAWSDPSSGIASDLRLYSLAAHEDAGYEEWGVSGSLRIVPHASGRGMSLSMTPSWGAQGQGNRIWSTRPSALVDEGDGVEQPRARLDTELGYGLFLSDHLTGTPYVGLGLGEARDYRLGWRLSSGRWQSFSLGVEAARREAANDNGAGSPEHRIGIEAGVRW